MGLSRSIAVVLVLAMILAGPVVPLMAWVGEDCCDGTHMPVSSMSHEEPESRDGCCPTQDNGTPADDRQPCPEEDPGDCDCPMPCCAVGMTMPLARAMPGLDLPGGEPEAFLMADPQSHSIEAHFSLLRPPRI